MASYFRIFWRRRRHRQEQPSVILTGAPAPPGEPVSAWTPYFKRTDNATNRRLPEENPHNPEHPATPAVPFSFASVEPATSIKRRDIRRIAIPSPFHHDKPLTTRITHITASSLYAQAPPPTRITHLTAQILYQRPTSQGHPETTPAKKGKKKKWGYIGGETSTSRRLLRTQPHDVFPITPPGFFAGQWPSHKPPPTFRTAFQRKLQPTPFPFVKEPTARVTHLTAGVLFDQAPPTTRATHLTAAALYDQVPPIARATHLSVTVIYRAPRSQGHPETTPAKKGKKKKWGYVSDGTSTSRRLLRLLPLDVFQPTPPGFFEGHWPAPKPFPTFKVRFDRTLQAIPELDRYKPPPISDENYAGYTPVLKSNQIEFARALQALELNEYPATPPGFRWPRPPMPTLMASFERSLQALAHNPVYPATPPGFFEGQWPSHKPPPTFKIEFVRARQTLPELDRYKPPPVSDENYSGYTPVSAFKVSFKRTLQVLAIPPEYPPTPPGFRWPRPSFPTFTVEFNRTRQVLPQLDERPPTPPGFFEGFFPAPIRLKRIPSTYHREAQSPLELNERPPTPPGFRWPRPPMPTLKASFTRTLQPLAHNPAYPATPLGFFAGQWPSHKPPPTFKVELDRTLQTPLEIDEYPAAAPVSIPVAALDLLLKANRVEFKRQIQKLPPHPEDAPETPVDIVPFVTPLPQRNRRHSGRYL